MFNPWYESTARPGSGSFGAAATPQPPPRADVDATVRNDCVRLLLELAARGNYAPQGDQPIETLVRDAGALARFIIDGSTP